jgi:hypothetical protein
MASEYTHVVQAKGKAGDWKNMTKHTSQGDAKKALTDAKTSTKGKGEFRITPFDSTPAAKPAAAKAPATKAAPKAAAKPAARKAK